jgi:hypothetical protein
MQNIFIELLPPWVETGLQPAFYDKESGTVLQQVSRMYAKINQLIGSVNNQNKTITDYIQKFIELKDYVDTYFNNLDVQTEINNKLDQMATDGTLQEIVSSYLQANVAWTFDSVADMQSATNLVDGSYARTLGYNTINDKGGAIYYITTTPSDITVGSSLYAHIVIEGEVNVKQFGAKGDDTTDDTNAIQACINFAKINKLPVYIPSGKYRVSHLVVNYQFAHIHGDGKNSVLKSINNNTEGGILNLEELGACNSIVRDIYIHGNKENNTAKIDGLKVIITDYLGDSYSEISGVEVVSCTDAGFRLNGTSIREIRVKNCRSAYNLGHGFVFYGITDSIIESCTSSFNHKNGFYITGSNLKFVACKAHHCGCGDGVTIDQARTPASAYKVTTDSQPIAGKKYYTRSGNGTPEEPYIFTEFTGSEFNGSTTHYEMTKTYLLRYAGAYVKGIVNTFTGCEFQDNAGDGVYVGTGNHSFADTLILSNGLIPASIDDLTSYISYDTAGLEQIYDGIHVEPWGNVNVTACNIGDYRTDTVSHTQRSGIAILSVDGLTNASIITHNLLKDVLLEKEGTGNTAHIVVNGDNWYDQYDVTRLQLPANYSIGGSGATSSYLKKHGNRKYMRLVVVKSSNYVTNDDLYLTTLPPRFKPKTIKTMQGYMSSALGYNISGTATIILETDGRIHFRGCTKADTTCVIEAEFE